ncbi:MAG: glycosyltransferase family 2 protein [Actinomycetota bacterium]|nr:glycosyltransferase family 2 protein [Actinomycetota bacterium]
MRRDDETSRRPPLRVSVISPVLNERHHLPALVDCIEAQTRSPFEAVFADGGSDDGTREWLEEARQSRPWIQLVANPDRVVSAGLNRAFTAASGDVVARMDGHAWYPPDYLERLVDVLARHPGVVGVGGALQVKGEGAWGRAIASVLARPIGLGGAPHRMGRKQGPTYHVGTGMYRRAALLAIGGFDPSFAANEDFEIDQRLRDAGGAIWLEPSAWFVSFTRETPRALTAQMWRYGYYKARTLWKHPRSLRLRHLAPPGLVIGLIGLTALRPRRTGQVVLVYLSAAGTAGGLAARADRASPWRGGLLVPFVHLAWGAGLLAGLASHRGARHEAPRLTAPASGAPATEVVHPAELSTPPPSPLGPERQT